MRSSGHGPKSISNCCSCLSDPQWQPYLVFPGEYVEPERVTHGVEADSTRRPLFILLDATWTEARKIFRKSPYFDALPILSLLPEKLSRYRLRRSTRSEHLCTAEVAALCLDLAGDVEAASALDAYFDVFSQHYLDAKHQLEMNVATPAHAELMPFVQNAAAGDVLSVAHTASNRSGSTSLDHPGFAGHAWRRLGRGQV